MSGTRRAPRTGTPHDPQPPRQPVAVASSPWIVVLIGVGVMVVLLVVAVGTYRGRGSDFDPAPPGPGFVVPPVGQASSAGRGVSAVPGPVPGQPGLSPRATSLPSDLPTGEPGSGAAAPATPPPAGVPSTGVPASSEAPPPPASVVGRYQVLQTFSGGFIAEVLVRNTSAEPRAWTARLDFPGGRLVAAWLEGVPQGSVHQSGGSFTYRSGPDLAAGASVSLRFHIEGPDRHPASCTVDGRDCAGG
ncbi:Cellulose binding domain-containing protein [Micromonospora nigra]|uniref:Cellulose binding domain-containing protein n=1 Tax=Micromonospora nigra TaxID=145857 RepID=A0A1C6REE3_9ACTN|nr:cellulose binding domain-containing protein [Micromonospora nigra]SCL15438.1 Cellulose binding domain-containing protein [Micromonospora nigra]